MELNEIINLAVAKLAELNLDGKFISKLDAYTKPTNHSQDCWICRKYLRRGERIVKEMVGVARDGQHLKYSYSHLSCYLAMVLHTILELKEGNIGIQDT